MKYSEKLVYLDDNVPFILTRHADDGYLVALAKNILRFLPPRLKAGDVRRYHGVDERITVLDQ
jgi:hypothetical protein